jgi:ribosome-binding ATPase
MNLKIGIVGLPNAGKSTLFNALLKKQVADAAPYPFCTIEPNIGVVPVPDERLNKLAQITQIEEKMDKLPPLVPAVVEFVDIAGLVKGASKGEGLGNKFLSHIREVDIICHVVREFEDPTVVHVSETIDSARDREIIETELILADLQTLDKQTEPNRNIKDKYAERKWVLIQLLKKELNNGKNAHAVISDAEDWELLRDLHLLTAKPVLYVINVSEKQLSGSNTDNSLQVCAKIEFELASLPLDEQKEYLASLGLESSGLDRLIRKTYEMLGLISFLTSGVKECRAWTIAKGMSAQKAAGVIHTDFEKKFIKADVVGYEDFLNVGGPASTRDDASSTRGGWKKAREAGKVRQEGRDYIMNDGDVVEFKIGS